MMIIANTFTCPLLIFDCLLPIWIHLCEPLFVTSAFWFLFFQNSRSSRWKGTSELLSSWTSSNSFFFLLGRYPSPIFPADRHDSWLSITRDLFSYYFIFQLGDDSFLLDRRVSLPSRILSFFLFCFSKRWILFSFVFVIFSFSFCL